MEPKTEPAQILENWDSFSPNDRFNVFMEIFKLPADQLSNRRAKAALNQKLAADFYGVMSNSNKNDGQKKSIKEFVNLLIASANSGTDDDKRIRGILNSARAQAGAVDLLVRSGYKLGKPDKYHDLQGLDIVAFNKDRICLIDVKAEYSRMGSVRLEPKSLSPDTIGSGISLVAQSLPDYFKERTNAKFVCLEIEIGVATVTDLFERMLERTREELLHKINKTPLTIRKVR